jgi:hypothetical protein
MKLSPKLSLMQIRGLICDFTLTGPNPAPRPGRLAPPRAAAKFRFQDCANPSIAPGMLTDKDNLLRRLHALRSEHRDLDTVIARITEHGPLDQLQVQRLKKRKLGLKDEIAWLESRLIPDRTA